MCVIVGGCSINVNHSETQYACETSDICPVGVECVNGLCIVPCSGTSCATGDGEILNYSFDDQLDVGLVHDRSGNRLDGRIIGGTSIPGRFGLAVEFEESFTGIVLPLSPLLFSEDTITIEALVRPADLNRDRIIYGNHELLEGVDYSFGITEDNTLEFITSDGCSLTVSYQSTSRVGTSEWQHVAVTWDGDMVRFYLDGVEGGVFASDVTPCAFQGKYHVGVRADGSGEFVGGIDEVKVSGYANLNVTIKYRPVMS